MVSRLRRTAGPSEGASIHDKVPYMLTRRRALSLTLAALPLRSASMDRTRLSILTDEIGTLDEAIVFAKHHRLKWVEIRAYRPASAATLKDMRRKLDDAGLGVSFYNSALLKFTLPGTAAVAKEDFYENLYAREGLTPEKLYAQRDDTLKRTIEAAHALGVSRIRGFTFWRVADPAALLPRLSEAYSGMVAEAAKSRIVLCVENENATNTATTAETVALLERVPGLQLNWDPQNSVSRGEKGVFPLGYSLIPKTRLANIQVKAEGLIGPGNPVDWAGIFRALRKDGYEGCVGLETHTLKGPEVNVPASHKCMERMIELAGES